MTLRSSTNSTSAIYFLCAKSAIPTWRYESVWVCRRLCSLEVRMGHGKRETRTEEVVAFIDAHRDRECGGRQWGVEPICAQLQIAPSTYYDVKSRPPSIRAVRDAALGPPAGGDLQEELLRLRPSASSLRSRCDKV